MLEHLIEFQPEILENPAKQTLSVEKASPEQIFNAQVATTDWLKDLGVEDDSEVVSSVQQQAARESFIALSTHTEPKTAKEALMKVQTPQAVRHIVGMLTAYDWEFVQQAKELRGMAVAKIVEETEHPDARIRLKALELLGRVTEVGLFTDRVEIKKADLSDSELDQRIKEKLNRLAGVVDVKPEDVQEKTNDSGTDDKSD
jgi:delta 1-pyrroline-5-carboxylate dehydrogenase